MYKNKHYEKSIFQLTKSWIDVRIGVVIHYSNHVDNCGNFSIRQLIKGTRWNTWIIINNNWISFSLSNYYYVEINVLFTIFSGCSCVVYSSSYSPQGGSFMSPDFPKRYPSNIDCLLYTFTGHQDEIVELKFDQFNLHRGGTEWVFHKYFILFTKI